MNNPYPLRLQTLVTVLCAFTALTACGDDDGASSEPEGPIVPAYGVNTVAYEGIGFDTLLATGLTGSGVTVCVVDTGIDASHPAGHRGPAGARCQPCCLLRPSGGSVRNFVMWV